MVECKDVAGKEYKHVLVEHWLDCETEVTRRLTYVMTGDVVRQQHMAPDLMDNPERVESRQGQDMPQVCVTWVMHVTVEKMREHIKSTLIKAGMYMTNHSNQEREEHIVMGHMAELISKDQPSREDFVTTIAGRTRSIRMGLRS